MAMGANDSNVPVVETLPGRGIPIEYILFPDEGHGFRMTASRPFAATAIARWFAAYL